jgi:hypothetical protein
MDGMFSSPQESGGVGSRSSRSVVSGLANSDCHLPSVGDALDGAREKTTAVTPELIAGDRESPNDGEKEERRRAAHRVLGKQG